MVFLHAGVADSRMWAHQVERVALNHQAIAFDRRGFGQTKARREDHSSVGDLLSVLDQLAGGGPAVLVGSSQGGKVAVDAALEHPRRIRGLVLIAPAIGQAPPAEPSAAVKSVLDEIDAAEAAGDSARVNELEAQLWLDGPLEPRGRVGGPVRDLFLDMNGRALGAPDPGRNTDAITAYGRLSEIRVPTLVGWGDFDLPHIQDRCRYIVEVIEAATACEFPGTAHLPNLEQPARVTDALAAFLATL